MRRAWRRMHSSKDGRRPVRMLPAILVLVVTLSCVSMATARTWLVEPDGSGDAPTIQAAADSSAMGDSILVQPGMYVEQVTLTDGTSLIGSAGAAATTIDGDGIGFTVQGVDVLIQGLKLIGVEGNGYGYGGYGVLANGDSEVRECVFEGSWGGALTNENLTISDSEFRNGSILSAAHLRLLSTTGSLAVYGCLFDTWTYSPSVLLEEQEGHNGGTVSGDVRDSVFRDCMHPGIVGYAAEGTHMISNANLAVESNLFIGCGTGGTGAGLVGPLALGVSRESRLRTVSAVIRGNTFVRNDDGGLGHLGWPGFDPGTLIENNVLTGNGWGLILNGDEVGVTVSCNLVWGNGQNWVGIPDPKATGNLTEPPLFCDFAGGNFTAAGNSPLLAANNSCGVQIGAFGQGCGPISVIQSTWARIKGLYRE